jgi:oligopeptidase B
MLLLQNCKEKETSMNTPPIAEKIPHITEIHGETINDEYSWLRDKDWPVVKVKKIINYLEEENKYFEQFVTPLKNDKEKIFEELKGRIKLADQSTYVKKDDFYYYTRIEADKEYPIYCRKKGSIEAAEEILLDINKLAIGHKYTKLGTFAVSPDHKLIGYSIDFSGDEKYTIKIYDIESKKLLTDELSNTIGDVVWHENLNGFFYTPVTENWRTDKVLFHKLGTEITKDSLVLHEPDPLYNVGIAASGSRKFIFIKVSGHACNETYVIDMNDDSFITSVLKPKEDKIFYNVEHNGNYFYILTNENAKNFRLMRVLTNNFKGKNWEEYVKEQPKQYFSSFDVTQDYLIMNYRQLGLDLVKIKNANTGHEKIIDFPEEAYTAEAGSTNYEENDIRVGYSSLARPNTTYTYDYGSDKLTVLKVQEIPSGFNPEEYVVKRIFVNSENVKVPVSLFYKKSLFKQDGSNPMYLYGYGSYGISATAHFRNSAVSLVNRGFIYAIAHIRGGDDLGHEWYVAAKFLNKKRTFADFIACAQHLITEKYTSLGNIVICGGSAGGLLIGNVINQQPELFKAAIAHVPFVDVLNTMLDETLPLTPGEFKEWGNPKDKEYFEYIKSYSPYENIKTLPYPNLMVTAGISDPRVGYWEAAKWVAKIRANKKHNDENIIIFKTNMDAGHSGASGRFDYLKEAADDLVFIFKIFKKKV